MLRLGAFIASHHGACLGFGSSSSALHGIHSMKYFPPFFSPSSPIWVLSTAHKTASPSQPRILSRLFRARTGMPRLPGATTFRKLTARTEGEKACRICEACCVCIFFLSTSMPRVGMGLIRDSHSTEASSITPRATWTLTASRLIMQGIYCQVCFDLAVAVSSVRSVAHAGKDGLCKTRAFTRREQ